MKMMLAVFLMLMVMFGTGEASSLSWQEEELQTQRVEQGESVPGNVFVIRGNTQDQVSRQSQANNVTTGQATIRFPEDPIPLMIMFEFCSDITGKCYLTKSYREYADNPCVKFVPLVNGRPVASEKAMCEYSRQDIW